MVVIETEKLVKLSVYTTCYFSLFYLYLFLAWVQLPTAVLFRILRLWTGGIHRLIKNFHHSGIACTHLPFDC